MSAGAEAGQAAARPERKTLLVYGGILVVYFMANLDVAVVSTSLPAIAGDLGNVALFGWVGAAYLIALASTSPFYAKLGDMFGRRSVVFAAIGLFLAGSLACGIAWSMESLIAARVLQGLGAGGLTVSAYATIGELFEGRERAKYQGYVSIVFTLAAVGGPILGGVITDLIGWRWIFLVNLPLGLAVLVILATAMPRRPSGTQHSIDYAGGVLLAVGTASLIYWSSYVLDRNAALAPSLFLPLLAAAALAAFVVVERRAVEPIIPLRLFADRTIALSVAATVVAGTVSLGLLFHAAFYLQTIAGLTSTQLGLLMLATPLASMVTATLSGRLVASKGRYKWLLVAAMAIGAANMLGFASTHATTPVWVLAVLNGGVGLSLGLWMQVVVVAAQNAAPRQDIGVATGLVTQSRALGGSLGLALNGGVATWALTAESAKLPPAIAALLPGGLSNVSPAAIAGLPAEAAGIVLTHFASGFRAMYLVAAGLFGVALLLMLLLRDVQIEKR